MKTVKRAKYELLSPEGIISFEHDTRSFADSARDGALDTGILLNELACTQPLSAIMDARIQALRDWARERTVPAHA